MKDRIELIQKLGLTEVQATDFLKNLAQEAYEAGYSAGKDDEPAIIGQTLGQSGQDFFEWWEEQIISKTMGFKKTTLIRNSQYGLTGIANDIKKMSFKDAPIGARFKHPVTESICVKINAFPKSPWHDGKGLIVIWNGNVKGNQKHFSFVDEKNGITFDTVIELI